MTASCFGRLAFILTRLQSVNILGLQGTKLPQHALSTDDEYIVEQVRGYSVYQWHAGNNPATGVSCNVWNRTAFHMQLSQAPQPRDHFPVITDIQIPHIQTKARVSGS